MREGRGFINSTQVLDLIKLNAVFTPEVSKKRSVGQRNMQSKVLGYDVTGTITQFKGNQWVRNAIKEYIKTGVWPEMDIQGVMSDPDSDYVKNFGEERIQLLGVVLTGDLPVLDLDAEGEEVVEEISFNAAEIRYL